MSLVYNSVINFYNGKSVLITGGTGSLGKIVLEKLLRSCGDLENVYLLVRPKKGLTSEQRISEMMDTPVIIIYQGLFFLTLIIPFTSSYLKK